VPQNKDIMGFLRITSTRETDEELLALYRNSGRADYFGRLYDRYIPLVYGLCLKYLKDEEEAQDAVMQLFEDLVPKVLKHDIHTFRTWLYTVSRNHCMQILRHKEHAVQVEFKSGFMESDDVLYLLDEEDDNSERIQALQHCMEKLPEQQRVSIIYFFHDGLSYADIVDTTGYPLARVKSYIQNGKRNLKICIEKACNIE
jgi:RNA polymerase sigma-70 factor (ECF subfamily)